MAGNFAISFRVRHNRHGIYTMPPHCGHRCGGTSGTMGSSSQKHIRLGWIRRLPVAIAPIVPLLTPVIRAILRWLNLPEANNRSTCSTRSAVIMLDSPRAKKRARRRKITSAAGLLWIPAFTQALPIPARCCEPSITDGLISRDIFVPKSF